MKPYSRVVAGLSLACLPACRWSFIAHAPLTGITRRPLEPLEPSQARPHQRSLLETGGAVLPIACFANEDQTLSSLAFFTVARHCATFLPIAHLERLSWSASTATAPPLHSQCAIIAAVIPSTCSEPDDKTLQPFREPLSLSHQFAHTHT